MEILNYHCVACRCGSINNGHFVQCLTRTAFSLEIYKKKIIQMFKRNTLH